MKKISGRAIVVIIVIIFFLAAYVTADVIGGNRSVPFGYWVANETEDAFYNFLVLGTDKDENRTDLILFCQYDGKEGTLKAIQIPRDTRVENTRYDKKINSAYGSERGILELKEETASLIGIYPEKYVTVNFDGFCALIDSIGGIEFNVPMRMYYTDPAQNLVIDLMPGEQTLDGKKAEMFMRFRKNNDGSGYAEGDIGRLKAHKKFYRAVINKVVSLKGIANLGAVMDSVGDNLQTDFSLSDLVSNIDGLKKLKNGSIKIFTLPGRGEYRNENGRNISYYIYDKEKSAELIEENFKFTK